MSKEAQSRQTCPRGMSRCKQMVAARRQSPRRVHHQPGHPIEAPGPANRAETSVLTMLHCRDFNDNLTRQRTKKMAIWGVFFRIFRP